MALAHAHTAVLPKEVEHASSVGEDEVAPLAVVDGNVVIFVLGAKRAQIVALVPVSDLLPSRADGRLTGECLAHTGCGWADARSRACATKSNSARSTHRRRISS